MRDFMEITKLFPKVLRRILEEQFHKGLPIEEIRVRVGQPIVLRWFHGELECGQACVTRQEMSYLIDNATECSFHTAVRFLQQGYIPLSGGSRMGVCGIGGREGHLSSLDDISSVCIRVAHAHKGCADEVYSQLFDGTFHSTIIIAPPGAGKTTLLRELIRKLSEDGLYVGVADERGELYGDGAFYLGFRCDVLSGIPKREAAMMLLRSMSPHILVMDEITAHGEGDALLEAVGCGVGLLTTVHGDDLRVLQKRGFDGLQKAMAFERAVLVHGKDGLREYEVVKLDA